MWKSSIFHFKVHLEEKKRWLTASTLHGDVSSSGSKRSAFNACLQLWEFKPTVLSFRRSVLVVEPFGVRLLLTLGHGIQDLSANMAAIKNTADHIP